MKTRNRRRHMSVQQLLPAPCAHTAKGKSAAAIAAAKASRMGQRPATSTMIRLVIGFLDKRK